MLTRVHNCHAYFFHSSLLTPLPKPTKGKRSSGGKAAAGKEQEEEEERQPTEPMCVLPGGCVDLPVRVGLNPLMFVNEVGD